MPNPNPWPALYKPTPSPFRAVGDAAGGSVFVEGVLTTGLVVATTAGVVETTTGGVVVATTGGVVVG